MRTKRSIISLIFMICAFMLVSAFALSSCGGSGGCEHNWTEATCTEAKTCTLCKATEGAALGHDYGDFTTDKDATCTESGSKTRTCRRCRSIESEAIAALGHDIETHDAKDATCSEVGNKAYESCKRCDHTTYEEIPKTAHTEEVLPKNDATCSQTGLTEGKKCSVCEEIITEQKEIPKTDHIKETISSTEPTCTESGFKSGEKCSVCGEILVKTEQIPATGHKKTEIPAKDPTCTESGLKAGEKCSVCGEILTEQAVIPALGHKEEKLPAAEATCTKTGLTEGSKCSVCNEIIIKQEEVPMLNHIEKIIDGTPATCTEDGISDGKECTVCGTVTVEQTKIPAGHNYDATVVPPTCTEQGHTIYKCTLCGDEYTTIDSEPTGHAKSQWFMVERPSAESDGKMRMTCMNCNWVDERPLDVINEGNFGHSTSGTPKDPAYYKLYETGLMLVSGSGKLFAGGEDGSTQPFAEYRDKITEIVICEGITEINTGSLSYLKNVTNVEFPSTLTKIGDYAFYGSFKAGITKLTIPASVTKTEHHAFGFENNSAAVFTEITVENPNMTFNSTKGQYTFNNGINNSEIILYSYGASNKTSSFANKIGAKYINLEDVVIGTVGNINYHIFNGKLTLSVYNENEAALLTSAPWLEKTASTDIQEIEIKKGITAIPADFFKDYTKLSKVTLPDTVTSISDGAFATSAACEAELNINFPKDIASLGNGIFKNRTNVYVSAYDTEISNAYKEDGVTVDIFRSIKILLIGNSLSQDAADCQGSSGLPSQLYEMFKAVLGSNSYVEIGVAYGGAKTATWHATKAEQGTASHAFIVISDKTNGVWENQGSKTLAYALEYADWDVVTIQPYAAEATKGIGSMAETDGKDGGKDEKFLPLSVSLPFLLDFIDTHAPTADVYYYMTWSNPSSITTPNTTLDYGLSGFNMYVDIAKQAMSYTGTNSGKGFAGVINAGTAMQNAKRTYLAYLYYRDGTLPDNKDADGNIGLNRDNVHASYHVGRYIIALTFTEILIPENRRADGYTIPDMYPSDMLGTLPEEYAEIAKLAAKEAAKSAKEEGNLQYQPSGAMNLYLTDPAKAFAEKIPTLSFANITADSKAELEKAIEDIISADAKDGIRISVTVDGSPVFSATASSFTAKITVSFGYTIISDIEISGTVKTS